jgi:hypothetical protein
MTLDEIKKIAEETKGIVKPVEIKDSADSNKYDRVALARNKTKKVLQTV